MKIYNTCNKCIYSSSKNCTLLCRLACSQLVYGICSVMSSWEVTISIQIFQNTFLTNTGRFGKEMPSTCGTGVLLNTHLLKLQLVGYESFKNPPPKTQLVGYKSFKTPPPKTPTFRAGVLFQHPPPKTHTCGTGVLLNTHLQKLYLWLTPTCWAGVPLNTPETLTSGTGVLFNTLLKLTCGTGDLFNSHLLKLPLVGQKSSSIPS